MNIPFRTLIALLAFVIATGFAATAESTDNLPTPQLVEQMAEANDLIDEVTAAVSETFLSDNLATFFKSWNIDPKFLKVKDSETDSVLGFDYSFHRAIKNRVINADSNRPIGVSLTFDAQGTVAVEADKNPNNLLQTGATLHAFQGIGGLEPSMSQEAWDEFAIIPQSEFANSVLTKGPEYYALANRVITRLKPQFFWDLQANGALESDQRFKRRQWVYGASLSAVGRDWSNNSRLKWLNIPDYPFAVLRWFFDHEDFSPSARVLPTITVGIDQVDPTKDEERLKLDPSLDKYTRFRAEVSFKTRFARWDSAPLYINASYRHFQESEAVAAVKAANADRSDFFTVKLDLPARFFLNYTTGRLPLDQNDDDVYAIGWSLHE